MGQTHWDRVARSTNNEKHEKNSSVRDTTMAAADEGNETESGSTKRTTTTVPWGRTTRRTGIKKKGGRISPIATKREKRIFLRLFIIMIPIALLVFNFLIMLKKLESNYFEQISWHNETLWILNHSTFSSSSLRLTSSSPFPSESSTSTSRWSWMFSTFTKQNSIRINDTTAVNINNNDDEYDDTDNLTLAFSLPGRLHIFPPLVTQQHINKRIKRSNNDNKKNISFAEERLVVGSIFYPLSFFDTGGPGEHVTQTELIKSGLDYPMFNGHHHLEFQYVNKTTKRKHSHHLVYNMMMKSGSSSILSALKHVRDSFNERYDNNNNLDKDNEIEEFKFYYHNKGGALGDDDAKLLMSRIYEYQHRQEQQQQETDNDESIINTYQNKSDNMVVDEETFEIFTTVRDPISRFVSAIAQEMYVHNKKYYKAIYFRDDCLKSTTVETISCAIMYVRKHFWSKIIRILEQPHFIPMTTNLIRRWHGYNVSVKVFDTDEEHFNDLLFNMLPPSLIQQRLQEKTQQHSQQQDGSNINNANTTKTKKEDNLFGLNQNIKDEKKAQGSDVILNMSVADVTTDMALEICRLYRMDVLMMSQLGYRTRCDEFITTELIGFIPPESLRGYRTGIRTRSGSRMTSSIAVPRESNSQNDRASLLQRKMQRDLSIQRQGRERGGRDANQVKEELLKQRITRRIPISSTSSRVAIPTTSSKTIGSAGTNNGKQQSVSSVHGVPRKIRIQELNDHRRNRYAQK